MSPVPFQTSEARIEGVYVISVAARILEMHPQTLRKYERVGLVRPSRTMGMLRLYSDQDIARLRLIKHLVDDVGMNLAGVEFVLQVFNRMLQARSLLETMQEEQAFAQDLRHVMQRLLEILDMEQQSP
ncbi:MAG: MerR family transcriptional regulator [Chloroflexi bacterium]|nr:MerR family transcriptional regulator [Chloroflexota bacterium]